MEERQQQVQVGAGLQESRLNTDLINFLQKYGSWAVYALLVVVLAYVGNNWWNQQREKKLDAAFADLRSAMVSSNPASLLDVSAGHPGTTVAALGRLEAVRLYLEAARLGLKPGANGAAPAPEDKLDEAGRRSMMEQAGKEVATLLGDTSIPETVRQRARWFRATIQADAGEYDAAIATMEEAAARAVALGYPDQEAKARERIGALSRIKSLKPVYSRAELPESAREPVESGGASFPGGGVDTAAVDPEAPRIINAPEGMRRLSKEEIERIMKSGGLRPLSPTPPVGDPAPGPPGGPPPGPAAEPGAGPSSEGGAPVTPPANPPGDAPPAEPKPS